MNQDAWVVIPAHNEEKTIKKVILAIKSFCSNVVVVDDGSSDKTVEIVEDLDVFLLKHVVNVGKGAALKTGCDFAFRKGADKIVVMDADGQHEPKEIPVFLRFLEGNDIVFGYRGLNKKMPSVLRLGNSFINFIIALTQGIKLNDSQCGYRAFTAESYKKIRWQAVDYSVESEMISKVGKNKLKYTQIPIQTIYGDNYKGTTVVDGIKIVLRMVLWGIFK